MGATKNTANTATHKAFNRTNFSPRCNRYASRLAACAPPTNLVMQPRLLFALCLIFSYKVETATKQCGRSLQDTGGGKTLVSSRKPGARKSWCLGYAPVAFRFSETLNETNKKISGSRITLLQCRTQPNSKHTDVHTCIHAWEEKKNMQAYIPPGPALHRLPLDLCLRFVVDVKVRPSHASADLQAGQRVAEHHVERMRLHVLFPQLPRKMQGALAIRHARTANKMGRVPWGQGTGRGGRARGGACLPAKLVRYSSRGNDLTSASCPRK